MQRPPQIRHTFFQMGTVIYRSYHIVLGFRKIFFFFSHFIVYWFYRRWAHGTIQHWRTSHDCFAYRPSAWRRERFAFWLSLQRPGNAVLRSTLPTRLRPLMKSRPTQTWKSCGGLIRKSSPTPPTCHGIRLWNLSAVYMSWCGSNREQQIDICHNKGVIINAVYQ